MSMQSTNPATGKIIAEFETWDNDVLQDIIAQVGYGFNDWAKLTTLEQRCMLLRTMAVVLRDDKDSLSELITLEMGKLYYEAQAEIEKCALLCDYYAEHSSSQLADEEVQSTASKSFVSYQPLGVVLGVMPWNFPFWQVFRFAVPTLTAGNLVVVKHASNVPQCALAIAEVFRKSGFPEECYSALMISASQVESVIRNPVIKAVSLTGSEAAGRNVASIAGSELKKLVLELGGSDAFIVLDNANIDLVVAGAVQGRFLNMGQSCIASKRFIIDAHLVDKFIAKFKQAIADTFIAGDPMDETTTMAPMARQDLLDELHQQVQQSVKLGATVITGGYQLDREGCYYAPTILSDVTSNMPAFSEEFFGPVAIILKATEPAHALGLANATDFGLSGSIWGDDIATAETMARGMESGATFINSFSFSDPRLPFGGIKNSGYGRELSAQGIREFTNIKTIWIK